MCCVSCHVSHAFRSPQMLAGTISPELDLYVVMRHPTRLGTKANLLKDEQTLLTNSAISLVPYLNLYKSQNSTHILRTII